MKKWISLCTVVLLLLSCLPVMANSSKVVTIMNCDTGRLITDTNGNTQFHMINDGEKTYFTDSEGKYLNLCNNNAELSSGLVFYSITALPMQRSLIQLPNKNYVYDSDEGVTNAATIANDRDGELIRCAWFITPIEEGRPLRILPLGDSLTYGVDLDLSGTASPRVSYRKTLSANLIDYFGAVAFVGNVDEYTTTIKDSYLLRHSGYSGYVIEDVYHVADHPGVKPMVDDMMAKYQPDIVIMMIGTNDIWLATMNSEIIPRWEDLVKQIEAKLPDNGLLLCSAVPPKKDSTKTALFNEKIQLRVRNLANEGLKVGYADPYTPLSQDQHVYLNTDGVHFNAKGYKVIGEVFNQAITSAYDSSGQKITPNPLSPADPYAESSESSSQSDIDVGSVGINPIVWILIGIGVAIVAAVFILVSILKKKK